MADTQPSVTEVLMLSSDICRYHGTWCPSIYADRQNTHIFKTKIFLKSLKNSNTWRQFLCIIGLIWYFHTCKDYNFIAVQTHIFLSVYQSVLKENEKKIHERWGWGRRGGLRKWSDRELGVGSETGALDLEERREIWISVISLPDSLPSIASWITESAWWCSGLR